MGLARTQTVHKTLVLAVALLAIVAWLRLHYARLTPQHSALHVHPDDATGVQYFDVTEIRANFTLDDLESALARKRELLAQYPADDFSTFGRRVRAYVKMHSMLLALDDPAFLRRITSCSSPLAGCLYTNTDTDNSDTSPYARLLIDEFRTFLTTYEHSLFPFLSRSGGDFPSAAHLYRTFTHSPRTRGIAIAVGNAQVRMAMVAIRSVRASGCTLPIEIMYGGDDDLSPDNRDKLLSFASGSEGGGDGYDVVTRDVLSLMDNSRVGAWGWALKPFAVLFASFSEVLFMDSDVLWFANPDEVFADAVFVETGTLFFTDRRTLFGISDASYTFATSLLSSSLRPVPASLRSNNAILARTSTHQQESGVLAVDKTRLTSLYGLLAACKLNSFPERDEVYKLVFGDKETFWLGWEAAGASYANRAYGWSPWSAAQVGYAVRGDQDPEAVVIHNNWTAIAPPAKFWGVDLKQVQVQKQARRLCSAQMAHLDASGTRLLWLNGGPLRDKFLGRPDNYSSPVVSPTHWAVEHHSRWEMFSHSIACLYLKPGSGPDVLDGGTFVDGTGTYAEDVRSEHGDGHSKGAKAIQYVGNEDGGVGGAIAHRLSVEEVKLFKELEGWWAETEKAR
ncbi:glycosyltransferase family 71 protein [Gonapodya prolifera JEL478]|uniref:Glycosyltransferase family 71 protein n=1 Tax=Gonapodya prolifera (strain JEL478) TaxID=1344416 RepID=A0A138ZZN2_GONPJ|nr:glycosyltransferase family 71 protein [Gonapodya prolifera JEL478]|eukprot:KXS09868.1 glycosyltransferase family 71 protein [Gonapodya prolifera JEL478]